MKDHLSLKNLKTLRTVTISLLAIELVLIGLSAYIKMKHIPLAIGSFIFKLGWIGMYVFGISILLWIASSLFSKRSS